MQLVRLPSFDEAMSRLRDEAARARILVALQRMAGGNPGDSKSLGRGLFECRIHHGPGYRVCFTREGSELILLLLCGSKTTQAIDIRAARNLMK